MTSEVGNVLLSAMPRSLTWSGDRYELVRITFGFDEGKTKVLTEGGGVGEDRKKRQMKFQL